MEYLKVALSTVRKYTVAVIFWVELGKTVLFFLSLRSITWSNSQLKNLREHVDHLWQLQFISHIHILHSLYFHMPFKMSTKHSEMFTKFMKAERILWVCFEYQIFHKIKNEMMDFAFCIYHRIKNACKVLKITQKSSNMRLNLM